jgi:hypothetical protein
LSSGSRRHSCGRAVHWLSSMIPFAIVLIVAVSMGIGAALLGYPTWAIPLIALLGAGGAVVAVRLIGWRGLGKFLPSFESV